MQHVFRMLTSVKDELNVVTKNILQFLRAGERRAKPASHLHERATDKIRKYRADYQNLGLGIAFAPAVVSVSGRIYGEFLHLLWILADQQARNYFALIDGDLDSDAFKWSRAGFFNYNKNVLGLAIDHSFQQKL